MQKTKQYRNMKVCVVKTKQQSKNKKHKSNRSQTIEDNCLLNEENIKQLEDTLKQNENTIDILKSNLGDNKKFIENNQNHKTNEIEINNSTQQDHNYVIKQNTKANTICQPVPTTKTLNHENVPAEVTENITENCPNNDSCNNNSNTHEAMSKTTKKISIPSDLIGNVIGKNGYRVYDTKHLMNTKHLKCEDSYKISKQKYTRHKSNRK